MERIMKKLNAISAAWRALPAHGTAPDMPLRWSVDAFGMLYLNGIWLCPARYVDVSLLDEYTRRVHDACIQIPLGRETLDIIIIREFDGHKIRCIERHI